MCPHMRASQILLYRSSFHVIIWCSCRATAFGSTGTQSCPKVSTVDWQLHSWLALRLRQFTQLLFLWCFFIGKNSKDYLSSCTVNPEQNYWHAVNTILFYKCSFANSHHSDMTSCFVTFLGKVNNLYSSRQDTNIRPKKGLLGSSLGNS